MMPVESTHICKRDENVEFAKKNAFLLKLKFDHKLMIFEQKVWRTI